MKNVFLKLLILKKSNFVGKKPIIFFVEGRLRQEMEF